MLRDVVVPSVREVFNVESMTFSEDESGALEVEVVLKNGEKTTLHLTSYDLTEFVRDPTEFFIDLLGIAFMSLEHVERRMYGKWTIKRSGKM